MAHAGNDSEDTEMEVDSPDAEVLGADDPASEDDKQASSSRDPPRSKAKAAKGSQSQSQSQSSQPSNASRSTNSKPNARPASAAAGSSSPKRKRVAVPAPEYACVGAYWLMNVLVHVDGVCGRTSWPMCACLFALS